MSTLRDVAAHAGVSVATASRVANASSRVRPETRARVQRAMRELLYVPPQRANEAHLGAAGAVGLLVPELENPIFPALAQAMERRAAALGLATILCNTGGDASTEADYVHMLLERRVQGMIFISCEATDLRGDHRHYARLAAEGARLVFVNSDVEGLNASSVRIDEQAAGRIATEHLLELGHRRIGFVAGPAHAQPTRDKMIGYEVALREARVEPAGLVAHGTWGFDGGQDAMGRLLAPTRMRPSGVICSSDLMAVGSLKAAHEAGVRVPEDLSIVGFDGVGVATWCEPPLTTLEQPIDEMAECAVRSLQTLFSDSARAFPELVFRPRLRIGGSTAPPPDRMRHG